ncbi:MAG: hypothetical protein J6K82_02940 [Alphaproteobacteria bacterium]|nr:hypothetical protein [Alphaproteobacteria bacterium]
MKTIRCMLMGMLVVLAPCGANAIVVTANISGSQKTFSEDVIVANGVEIYPDKLYINRTINIENNGRIESDILVADNRDLYIKNRGEFDSNFILGENSKLYQVISDKDDMNVVGFDEHYTAIINAKGALRLSDLINVVGDADGFVLDNALINFDVVNGISNVELHGNTTLDMGDATNVYGRVILHDVSGDGTVRIVTNNENTLFADVTYGMDGDLYLTRVRETDYVKILNNDVGVFLNDLRVENPSDGLLYELDRALSMDELNRIMNKSARLNSDILLRPIQIINAFDVVKPLDAHSGFYVAPTMVLSKDFMANYVVAGLGVAKRGEYDVSINLRSGAIEYETGIDAFVAEFFGGNIDLRYWINDVFVRAVGGMDFSKYDIGYVFYENNKLHNPDAQSMYAEIDFGYDFNVTDSVYVMPIVGVMGWGYSLDEISEFNTSAHVGIGAGYAFDMLGIEYDYSFHARINSDNYYTATLRAGFWSELDAAGGAVDVSLVRMFDVTSYKLSIGGRVWF